MNSKKTQKLDILINNKDHSLSIKKYVFLPITG